MSRLNLKHLERLEKLAEQVQQPVPYTHLTLPTTHPV